jgi:hypothetical protein
MIRQRIFAAKNGEKKRGSRGRILAKQLIRPDFYTRKRSKLRSKVARTAHYPELKLDFHIVEKGFYAIKPAFCARRLFIVTGKTGLQLLQQLFLALV